MDRIERIVLLHRQLLSNRFGLSTDRLLELAQCSRPTLHRDLEFLRDALGAPLEHDNKRPSTWRYTAQEQAGFQLPGIWLSPDELYAMLLTQQVFKRSGAGVLGDAVARIEPRLHKLLGEKARQLSRLRVLRTRARRCDPAVFRIVAEAVLERRQLRFTYSARSTGQLTERVISPQRLTHYADNWYLDAWETAHTDLRSFALDRIQQPKLEPEPALDLPEAQLDARQDGGYGVFSGPVRGIAILRFSAHAARWVIDEQWHPQQKQRVLPDGRLELELPYANPRELLMDVQRYGADAEVVGPAPLRRQMRALLVAALGVYGNE